MSRFNKILTGIMAVPGLWLAVTGRFVWATPQAGQPALVSDHAQFHGHGPTGFDQAQAR